LVIVNLEIMGIKLTEEQKGIIKAFKDTEKLKINAYAGTGKTTTIRALAEVYPRRKFLVLTFNRSIAEELKNKMPPNCMVYTIHGLAYKFLPEQRKKDLVNKKVFVDELIKLLEIDSLTANFYKDVFEAFCNSVYLTVNKENIRKIIFSNYQLKKKFYLTFGIRQFPKPERKFKIEEFIEKLSEVVEYIFFAIAQRQLSITHDFYLKVFQQNLEDLKDFFKRFDAILVDEGQDLNGVQEYVLRHAPIPQKLIVGDRHQSIYSWRGAINTLARLKDWEEKSLTISFRFENNTVVNYANKFLHNWKGDENEIKSEKTGRTNGLKAYITRTNAKLVEILNRLNEPITFSRDLNEIFRSVREAERLLKFYYFGNESLLYGIPGYIKNMANEARKESESVEEFIDYFAAMGEIEYAHALWIAEKYDIGMLYEKAKKLYSPDARTVLTTAHSSKGLEFDRVYFTEDFPDLMKELVSWIESEICELKDFTEEKAKEVIEGIKENKEEYGEIIDEMNLQYVALTRVIKRGEGPGYTKIKANFETKLSVETLMEAVKKELEVRKKYEKSWMEVSKRDDDIDWDKLEGEFEF